MDNHQQFYRYKRDEMTEVYPSELKKGDSIALSNKSEPLYGTIIIDDVWPILTGEEEVTIIYRLPKGASIDSHSFFVRIDWTTGELPLIEVTQKIKLDKVVLVLKAE